MCRLGKWVGEIVFGAEGAYLGFALVMGVLGSALVIFACGVYLFKVRAVTSER